VPGRHRDARDLVKLSGVDPKKSAPRKQPQGRASVGQRAGGPSAPVTGALHDALTRERAERLSSGGSGAAGARMNRLGGVLVLPASVMAQQGKPGEGSGAQEGAGKRAVAQLVRDPRLLLDEGAFARPHANKKRSKANFTFVQVRHRNYCTRVSGVVDINIVRMCRKVHCQLPARHLPVRRRSARC
jgi:hypothetical protein